MKKERLITAANLNAKIEKLEKIISKVIDADKLSMFSTKRDDSCLEVKIGNGLSYVSLFLGYGIDDDLSNELTAFANKYKAKVIVLLEKKLADLKEEFDDI
jgi:hypothetical protein